MKKVLPKNRHMDNVVLDTISSQEEEFAMANMSTISTYHFCCFPRNQAKYQNIHIFSMFRPELAEWKDKYLLY